MDTYRRNYSLSLVILVIVGLILACNLPTSTPESTDQIETEPAQIEEQTSQPEVQPDQPLPATELPSAPSVPNPPPYACAASGDMPDLVAEIISIENTTIVQAAEPWTWVEYRVTNYGTMPTPEIITSRVIVNGENFSGTLSLTGPLQPCESLTDQFAVGHQDTWPPGEYVIEVVADVFEEIQELDETNNISNSISFTVITP